MESQKPTQHDQSDDPSEPNAEQGSQLMLPDVTDSERTVYGATSRFGHATRSVYVAARHLMSAYHVIGLSPTPKKHIRNPFWDHLDTEHLESLIRSCEENYVSRLDSLEEHQRKLDFHLESAIRPMLAQRARQIELVDEERDPIPPAASAKYEWLQKVKVAVGTAEDLKRDFADIHSRLQHHIRLIEQVKRLVKSARSFGERDLESAVITLHDALRSVYSEDMTIEQVDQISQTVSLLSNQDWDREQVRNLDRTLRSAGFETIPSDRYVTLPNE